MEIIKVVGFAFAAVFIYLLLKDKKSDVAFYVLVVAGILIFMYMIGQLGEVINFIDDIASKANINTVYIEIVFKILAIAYITSFCSEICKDAGASTIASKVEFSGKIMILALAIPILMAVLDSILQIM
ncbi:stage III sporulation protein AD [Clostridium celatum]|uniref:Stage III sporulation protein AD n=1 Tax=Clostridium celatum DSM 1785 TaxID=545697 RepID=L1QHC1_9CLOT|nr:stage III sporulation protein AD [Clostridium celatum]EKY26992.1 stage III sporulation protein AD [Clostridium celatum DSM 1785]MCE9654749.1 stage III sporulation protein AD [Clostridium celatum]MDU6295812.1 stage III sporulation protein AD [Clostridium celatum]MDY3359293.1 stage III sporulation protein AD [Clostridium celatum]